MQQTAAISDELALKRKKQRLKIAALLRQDQPAEDKARIKQEKKAEKKERKKDEGKMSMSKTMQKKVLANLQLFVDKIHIRYEDNTTNPDQPFCFGITLEKFHAQTANGDWQPTIVKVKEQIVHKLIELRNLAFYFDTPREKGAVVLKSKNSTTAKLMSLHMFQDGSPPPEHNYIISPISGTMKLRMDQRRENQLDYSIPKLSAEISIDLAGFAVNKVQYSSAMEFLQYCQGYQKSAKYLRYRPDFEAAPNKARAYWKYAIDCVLADVRKNYQGWTWEAISSRKQDRITYVQLYTKRQQEGKKKLLPSELADLDRIERKYSYDDLLLYRKLSNTTILHEKLQKKGKDKRDDSPEKDRKKKDKDDKKEEKKEKEKIDKEKAKDKDKDKDKEKEKDKDKDKKKADKEALKAEKEAEKEAHKAEKEAAKEAAKAEKAEKKKKKEGNVIAALTSKAGANYNNEEVMEELYYSLGMQEIEAAAAEASKEVVSHNAPPPGYIKTELKFRLTKATFGLSEMPDIESRLASVITQDLAVTVHIRGGGSLTVVGDVGKFNIFDYHTLGGRELATLRPDPRHETKDLPLAHFVFDKNPIDLEPLPEATMQPAFRSSGPNPLLSVPTSPVASRPSTPRLDITSSAPTPSSSSSSSSSSTKIKVDYRIKFVAYPIYVTVSRPFIDRITSFFKVSKGKSKKVGANVANKAVSKVKKAGQKNLQKALKKRKVTQIDIDFTAPRIIIPESFASEDSAAMIIDFGHLVAKTTGPPPIPAGLIGAARAQAKKEAANYDHYDISVKGITSYFVWSQTELDQLIHGGLTIRGTKASRQQAYTADEVAGGASPNTLLRRLDVQVYVKLLSRAPTGKLARFKINGSMSNLELDLSTERVGALMGSVRAVTKKTTARQHADLLKQKHAYLDTRAGRSAASAIGYNSQSSKRMKVDSSDLIRALEAENEAAAASEGGKKKKSSSGASSSADVSGAPATAKKARPYKQAFHVVFEIPSVSVVVHHQIGQSQVPVPLVTASLQHTALQLIKSTHDMRANVRIQGMYIEDHFLVRAGLARSDRSPYYVINTINQRGHALVQIDFTQINKKSPLWVGVTNDVKISFNTLEVNINRPTLAALVATVAEYMRAMKDVKPVVSSAPVTVEPVEKEKAPKSRKLASGALTEPLMGHDGIDVETSGTWSAATASGNLNGFGPNYQNKRASKLVVTDVTSFMTATATSSTSTRDIGSSSDMLTESGADFTDMSLSSMSTSAAPKIDLHAQLALLAQEHEKQQESQGPAKKKITSKAPDKRAALRISVDVHMVRINLNRHTKTWFVVRFGDIGLLVSKHVDGTLLVQGHLGTVSARDKNEFRWHDIITISSEEAASFKFEQFKPTLTDYPGYKHSLNVNVASIRIVLLQRLIKETTKYFGGVSKMKKFAGAATRSNKPSANGLSNASGGPDSTSSEMTDDESTASFDMQRKLAEVEANRLEAEQSSKKKKKKKSSGGEKSALRLHVELGNPLLIIPKTGDDPEHLQLDLGRIVITNSFEMQGNNVKVDIIDIAATGLNIRAFVRDDTTTAKRLVGRALLTEVTMGLQFIRPLSSNDDFTVPDRQIIANMSRFNLFVSENELALILGIMSGNISEFPLRDDDEMPIVLKYLEGAHIGSWLDPTKQQQQGNNNESSNHTEDANGSATSPRGEAAAKKGMIKKKAVKRLDAPSSSANATSTDTSENTSSNGTTLAPISAATAASGTTPRGPLAKDARKVLDQVTRIKLLLKLNFDQMSATVYRGSGSDYLGQTTSLFRVGFNSFRLSFAQQADKGKVIKLNLFHIVLEDVAPGTRNQFRRMLASNPKDREDSSSTANGPPSPRKSFDSSRKSFDSSRQSFDTRGTTSMDDRRSFESSRTSVSGSGHHDYDSDVGDDDDGDDSSSVRRRKAAKLKRMMAPEDPDAPSETENSLSLVYEARPKAERFEVVTLKVHRPRIYVVPSAFAGLIMFVRPLIRMALRTISIFGKRKRLGSLGDQRRRATAAVEGAWEQMRYQLDSFADSQESELEELKAKATGKRSTTATREKLALKRNENEAALAKLKSELESGFATFVADVGKKVRSGRIKERRIKVMLRHPEICVLEDPERSRNVFMVHLSDATIKTHMVGKNQTIGLHLFEFSAKKAMVDPQTNETSERILLIQPFDVVTKLERVNEAETKLNNIKIKIGVIHTIVSYRDMKLAMAVIRGFGQVSKGFSASKQAVAKSIAANAITPLKSYGVAPAVVAKVKAANKIKPQLVLVFKVRVMNFTLLNDTNRLFVTPLLKIDIEGVENFLTRGNDMRLNLELRSIKCQAYNIDLAAYEPIVEPWGLDVLLKKEGKATFVNIKAETLLSINLTRSLLDTVFNTTKFFTALSKKKKHDGGDPNQVDLTAGPANLTPSIVIETDPSSPPAPSAEPSLIVSQSESNLKALGERMSLTHPSSSSPTLNALSSSSSSITNNGGVTSTTSSNVQSAERSFYPFIISNGTCKPIKFWFSHMNEDTAQYLEPEAECPIIIEKSSKQLLSGVGDDESSKFDINVEIFFFEHPENQMQFLLSGVGSKEVALSGGSSSGSSTMTATPSPAIASHQFGVGRRKSVILSKIPIDRVHSAKTYSLPGEFSAVQFVSENVRRGGTKILTLRTTQNIVNNTAHDVEIQITKPHSAVGLIAFNTISPSSSGSGKLGGFGGKPKSEKLSSNSSSNASSSRISRQDTHSMIIPTGKSKSIPLEFLQYASIKLRTSGYDWCEWTSRSSIVGICPRYQVNSGSGASRSGSSRFNAASSSSAEDYWSCVIVYDRIEDDMATYVSITLTPALQFENLLASMVLIKMLLPGESPDDVHAVVDVDTGREVAIYQSHSAYAKGSRPSGSDSNDHSASSSVSAADRKKFEIPSTNGDSSAQLTQQRFSICVGGFYWSEPIDLLQLYVAAATFKPGPQEKAAYERPMEVRDVNNRTLSFVAEVTEPSKGCLRIALYAQYWIINQTGLKLNYRVNGRSPILVDDNARSSEIKGDPRTWYRESDVPTSGKDIATSVLGSVMQGGSVSNSSSNIGALASSTASNLSGSGSTALGYSGDAISNGGSGGGSGGSGGKEKDPTKQKSYAGPGKWRLASPTKFYFSGDEFQAQVAGYGTTEVQQGKMATVINAAMDKFGAGNGASQWSSSTPLADRDAKKHNADIEHMIMADVKGPRVFEFHTSVKNAPGKFWRTQEIRISPQYVLVNKTKRHLVYRQVDPLEVSSGTGTTLNASLNAACALLPGDQLPFHWPDASQQLKQLSINYATEDPGLNAWKTAMSDGSLILAMTSASATSAAAAAALAGSSGSSSSNAHGLFGIPGLVAPETHWSGRFSIDAIDNLMIKIRDKNEAEQFDLINVSIKEHKGVKYVIFKEGSDDFIQLIRIENQSEWEIVVEQKLRVNTSTTAATTEIRPDGTIQGGTITEQMTIPPANAANLPNAALHVQFTETVPVRTIQPYYWDEPHKRTKILLLHVKPPPGTALSRNSPYYVSSLAEDASAGADEYVYGWKANSKQRFKVQVQVRGFTKVVVITSAGAAAEDIPEDGLMAERVVHEEEEAKSSLELEFDFAGIGLSIIDSFPQEIFYVSLKQATLRYRRVGKVHSIGFVAKTGQVDNQLYLAPGTYFRGSI